MKEYMITLGSTESDDENENCRIIYIEAYNNSEARRLASKQCTYYEYIDECVEVDDD